MITEYYDTSGRDHVIIMGLVGQVGERAAELFFCAGKSSV